MSCNHIHVKGGEVAPNPPKNGSTSPWSAYGRSRTEGTIPTQTPRDSSSIVLNNFGYLIICSNDHWKAVSYSIIFVDWQPCMKKRLNMYISLHFSATYIHPHTCIWIYIHIFTYIYIHTYTYIYTCIHTQTYKYILHTICLTFTLVQICKSNSCVVACIAMKTHLNSNTIHNTKKQRKTKEQKTKIKKDTLVTPCEYEMLVRH